MCVLLLGGPYSHTQCCLFFPWVFDSSSGTPWAHCMLITNTDELEPNLCNLYWHENMSSDVWHPPHYISLPCDYIIPEACLCDVFWGTESWSITMKRDLRHILWLDLLVSCWSLWYLRNPSSELGPRPLPHFRVINLETYSVLFQRIMFIWESHLKVFPKDV